MHVDFLSADLIYFFFCNPPFQFRNVSLFWWSRNAALGKAIMANAEGVGVGQSEALLVAAL